MRNIGKLTGYVPRGKYIDERDVPFKARLPLKLKNKVSGKNEKSSGSFCIQEMSVLFACLRKHDFQESFCPKELSSFQNCYKNTMKENKLLEERGKQGVLVPGQKRLTHKQVNELLKLYPTK